MSITATGYILIPLTLLIFALWPRRLAHWAILISAFGAASVVNFGGQFPVGVTPYFFSLLLIAARLFPSWAAGQLRFLPDEPIRKYIWALAAFVLWAVGTAFLMPILFRDMPVDLARAGPDVTYLYRVPLRWSMSNAGQAGYLILDLVFALELSRLATGPGTLEALLLSFTWSGFIVVVTGFYQMLAWRTHLPFPTWFFNTNAAWGQSYGQMLGAVGRVSATFTEPSSAGAFLASWCVFEACLAIRGRKAHFHAALALAGCVVLLWTTSTTGYVAAIAAWCALAWRYLPLALSRGRVALRGLMAVTVSIVGMLGVLFTPGMQGILNAVLFNKLGSDSALHRGATVWRGLDIFLNTWGLGVGLGSDRALSLLVYILANLGIVGALLVAYLFARLYELAWRTPEGSALPLRVPIHAVGWALATALLAAVLSGAEITGPVLWVPWGLMIALLRKEWLKSRFQRTMSIGMPFRTVAYAPLPMR